MKRKILLIAYYFPPLGGAGVSRPLALFKHLPAHDIEVDILTVKNISYRTFEPELLNGIDESKIYRSSSNDPQRMMYLLGMRKIKEKTISKGRNVIDKFFPDSKIGWVKKAVKLGRVLAENKKYDMILSTSPPISTHLVAKQLSKEFSIPFIADFRDYWTSYKPEDWYQDKTTISKAKSLLQEITQSASQVTTVSQPIADYIQTENVIMNSFDEERAGLWKASAENDSFYIGLLGTLDKLCVIVPLCEVLTSIRNTDEHAYSRIQVLQVGNINDPDFNSTLEKYNLQDKFEIHNHHNRTETIKILNKSHLMYLGLNENFDSGIVTSRLFDMIASGRPILASVSEDSTVSKILEQIPHSAVFNNQTVQHGAEFVLQMMKNNIEIIPNAESVQIFNSSVMAERFAEVINKVLETK